MSWWWYLVFLLHIVHAGNRVGNGGNVAVCEDSGKVKKIQLLDFYEAGGFDYKIAGAGTDANTIVEGRIARLSELAPKLGEQYKRRFPELQKEWNVKSDVKLVKIDDSLHAFEPSDKGCSVQQIVIRLQNLDDDSKRFEVNERLWKELSPQKRAGLMMHEMIYEHLSKLGDDDSRNARKIVALMFSEKFATMTAGDFWLFIKKLQVPIYP